MQFRLRARWRYCIQQCFHKSLGHILTAIHLCQRNVYILLMLCAISLLMFWVNHVDDPCDTKKVLTRLCTEYRSHEVHGDFCSKLCDEDLFDFNQCFHRAYGLKELKKTGPLFLKTDHDPQLTWLGDPLIEGNSMSEFIGRLEDHLKLELGPVDHSLLIQRLFQDFDVNRDGKLNYGEAQTLWRVIHQPFFLAYYIFQDLDAIPHLNGTCGEFSIWSQPYAPSPLFKKRTPWPLSLFTNHAYRWTLPVWYRRAKVAVSLLELAEEFYERGGVRFHMCHISGQTLHRDPVKYEILLTEEVMLLSEQQIGNLLANRTCSSHLHCQLTPQCKAACNYKLGRCTSMLRQPTLVYICEVLEDYLYFDVPSVLRVRLYRLLRHCQRLGVVGDANALQHSIVLIDLKQLLWKYIELKKFK